jgi:hypothetical protein
MKPLYTIAANVGSWLNGSPAILPLSLVFCNERGLKACDNAIRSKISGNFSKDKYIVVTPDGRHVRLYMKIGRKWALNCEVEGLLESGSCRINGQF